MGKRENKPEKDNNASNENARVKREKKKRSPTYYRGKARQTSILFLLWTVFAGFAILIVLLFGATQYLMMTRSFKEEASREVWQKGGVIQTEVLQEPPEAFGKNYSYYLQFLSDKHDVHILILNEDGKVLAPSAPPNVDDGDEVLQEALDFSEEIEVLKKKLSEEKDEDYVVYEGDAEYVYGAQIEMYEGTTGYLYVSKSIAWAETATSRMGVRFGLISVFALVLSFAVSSAVAGLLTRPITEMTEKAQMLAEGDFTVDFHGRDYGQEMTSLAETLNFARDELSKTDKMQKELIANVSHDFKTPLTMIKAYASMIMEISGEIPEKRNKHAQVIVDEADRLASLVNDVLDLSKISSGIEELKTAKIDMSALVHRVLDRFAYLKETDGYVFETEIAEGVYTYADELMISQVLYNLIGNAVNYTGEDKKVYVRLQAEENGVFRFSVQDTGAGIKPEELSEIWDRYYRSSEMHKRPVRGTGLGLSIVKTILQRHKLYFGVDSVLGQGSTFYVLFPIA
ncbi:MAG: HAMP domain-containing protein [Clostridia bacterium]|nr:HAMP domain-containing protein [Clostridia bacterium]